MLAILAALLSAATPACTAVPGADPLWRPTIRWVIVGEMHGTNETPDAFANLVCLAAATHRPVTVALEYFRDGQAVIDAYLASNGDAQARAALLTLPLFTSAMQDGRGSVAFLRLFERLRLLKHAGLIGGVVASDVGRATPPGQSRDAAMAQAWTAIPIPKNGIVIALVGNRHARRTPVVTAGRVDVTAASLMPPKLTVTMNVDGNGGSAWICQREGCGARTFGPPHVTATEIVYSTDPDRWWDASYQLGGPTTAAEPAAKPVKVVDPASKPAS